MNRLTPLLAAWLLAATAGADAGPLQRRLELEARLVRDASFSGVERGQSHLVQSVNLQVVLTSDGTPLPHNPLDPDDPRRQLERAQRTQQKVDAALHRAGPSAARPALPPQELQAQAQAMMARCGQDRDCLMREASALSAAQVGRGQPQVQARLEAYGSAVRGCEARHTAAAAREACIAQARRQAGGSDDSDADEVVETPYLMFTGTTACQLDATTRIEERTEGRFDDVQGVVPYTTTLKAEGRDRDTTTCPMMQAVLDTRSGRLWTRVLPALRAVPASTVRAERGRRPQQSDGPVEVRWHEAQDWLTGRLANLGAGGSDRLERPLPGGRLELQLRWKFAPL